MKRNIFSKNNSELIIVSQKLPNKFEPLDISVNQSAKNVTSTKFNSRYADSVNSHFPTGIAPGDVNVPLMWAT